MLVMHVVSWKYVVYGGAATSGVWLAAKCVWYHAAMVSSNDSVRMA